MDRILAIQVKQIGDLILTVPALRVLRRTYPEARITLVVRELCASLAPLFPFVSEVLVHRPFRPNLKLASLALPPRYDLSLDFSGTDRAVFCTLLGRARKRATFNKYAEGPFRKIVFNTRAKGQLADRHAVDYCLALLTSAGIESPGPEPLILTMPPAVAEQLAGIRYEHGIRSGYSVVHPGTAREEKYWNPTRWAVVIRHLLRTREGPVVLTGGSAISERTHIQGILDALRPALQERVIDLSGKLSLLESATILSSADLVTGVDTAAIHLASGFRRPTVALYGPTNPFQWGPRHDTARVVVPGMSEALRAGDFRPGLPLLPMDELFPAQVTRVIDELAVEQKNGGSLAGDLEPILT